MTRTNVYADPEDLAIIKADARRRGVSEAEIIRQGVHLAALGNQVWTSRCSRARSPRRRTGLRPRRCVTVPEVTAQHLSTARSLRASYRSLDLDLTDAVHVALAAEYQTNKILTLNRRDFRTIRPLTAHDHFRVLPDDL